MYKKSLCTVRRKIEDRNKDNSGTGGVRKKVLNRMEIETDGDDQTTKQD